MSLEKFTPNSGEVTMFTTTWCGYCRILKKAMDRENVSYNEVNIEEVDGAVDVVTDVNNGNQTVPTVLFSDGSAMTNPSIDQLTTKLGQLG